MSNDSSNAPVATPETRIGALPRPLVAFLLAIGLFFVGQLLASFFVQAIASEQDGQVVLFGSPIVLQFAFGALSYGFMAGALLALLRRWRVPLQAVGLGKPRLSDAGRSVVAFIAYISVYIVVLTIASQLIPSLNVDQKQDTGFDGAQGPLYLGLVFFLLVVAAPFVEELVMRGFLFGSLRRKRRYWTAAIITSLVFAVLHLGGGEAGAGPLWVAAIDTFVLSLVLCYLRERTGRIWAGVGLHAIKNGIAFAALFIFVSNS
jgi:membrane protease YdiL (CAAX protease family)